VGSGWAGAGQVERRVAGRASGRCVEAQAEMRRAQVRACSGHAELARVRERFRGGREGGAQVRGECANKWRHAGAVGRTVFSGWADSVEQCWGKRWPRGGRAPCGKKCRTTQIAIS
jgi:hypothetical protein